MIGAACRPEDRDDIDIAIAVCKLLQGEAQAAESLLGFGPQATKAPDPDIQIFLLVSLFCRLGLQPATAGPFQQSLVYAMDLRSLMPTACSLAVGQALSGSSCRVSAETWRICCQGCAPCATSGCQMSCSSASGACLRAALT